VQNGYLGKITGGGQLFDWIGRHCDIAHHSQTPGYLGHRAEAEMGCGKAGNRRRRGSRQVDEARHACAVDDLILEGCEGKSSPGAAAW
jgi:hypothetical protein